MKNLILLALLVISAISFTACEGNDYQHPGHRSK
jgi:predicted small secreted protein